jgi:putative colanic acid biosynthesis UDP-glucose lipid carrier transferase
MLRSVPILRYLYFAIDCVILVLSFFTSIYIVNHDYYSSEWPIAVLLLIGWFLASSTLRLYQKNLHNGMAPRAWAYLKAHGLFLCLLIVYVWMLPTYFTSSIYPNIVAFAVVNFILNLLTNSIVVQAISRIRRRPENQKHTIIAGIGDLAASISSYIMSNPDHGYLIDGYVSCNGETCRIDKQKVVGTIGTMDAYLKDNLVDEIVVALPISCATKNMHEIIRMADHNGARISYVPDYRGLFDHNFKITFQDGIEAVNLNPMPLDELFPAFEKAVFDILFSATAIFFLSPVFLLIGILIKQDSPGPVFYCPMRIGKGGKPFKLYKFRTMSQNDAEVGGTLSTVKDDPRITRIGKILRKYNLDELPQFFNVFLGDMSIVGPRPHRHFLNQQMKEHIEKYMIRHYFRPGITGWAQVNGWRGPTETEEQISQRTAHDLWYIENWSFLLDLKIVWMTLFSRKSRLNAF